MMWAKTRLGVPAMISGLLCLCACLPDAELGVEDPPEETGTTGETPDEGESLPIFGKGLKWDDAVADSDDHSGDGQDEGGADVDDWSGIKWIDGDGPGHGGGESGHADDGGWDTGDENGDTSDDPTPAECRSFSFEFVQKVPEIQLVVDRSDSMNWPMPLGSGDRWQTLRSVLLDERDGVVTRLEHAFAFGITLYNEEVRSCPSIDELMPELDQAAAIRAAFDAEGPSRGTPTAEALRHTLASMTLGDNDDPNDPAAPRAIILATDGDPHTCDDPDGDGKAPTLEAVQAAYEAGIPTYVIALGEDASLRHLYDLARAGAGDDSARPYLVHKRKDLVEALEAIIGEPRSCVLDLGDELDPAIVELGEVSLGGEIHTEGSENGWRLLDRRHLELLGDSCAAIQRGSIELEVEFACRAIDPQ